MWDFQFDDTELDPGVRVRRVTLRTFIRWVGPGRGSPAYIQCASDNSKHEAILAQFRTDADQKLADLDQETANSRLSLGAWLLGLSVAALLATVVGSILLVWLGLSPLHRLSEAVSQVSEKDFRLPLDERRLPIELKPIVDRLKQTLDQLSRAFAREKQAVADISHELRTPVAALADHPRRGPGRPRSLKNIGPSWKIAGPAASR